VCSNLEASDNPFWLTRFQLPDTLPPTFKGVAVRYMYQFHVSARYHDPIGAAPSAAAAVPQEAAPQDRRRQASPTASERSLVSVQGTPAPSRTPSGHLDPAARAPSLSTFLFRGYLGGSTADKPLAPAESYAWQEVNLRVPIHVWPPKVCPYKRVPLTSFGSLLVPAYDM
jgi:hypothetical protein